MKNSAKGLGYSSNSLSKDLTRIGTAKTRITTDINNAWRKAKEEDPSLEYKMSFVQFKKKYFKEQKKKK